MRHFYLHHILDPLFRWAFFHVPLFADYCVEFVHQIERKVHGKLLNPDYIQQARDAIGK
jgi:hypothetical protein